MSHLQRALLPCLAAAALSGCLLPGPHSRDQHRTLDQIRQEHRWAADQVGRRTPAEDLARVRAGEPKPSRDARRRLVRLTDALDRITWMREATPRGLWASADDRPDIDELAFRFERAARLRQAALAEADELAEALAASPAPNALSFAELRKSLAALHAAEQAEDRTSAALASLTAKEPSLRSAVQRFAPLPPPSPRPFVGAAAAYLRLHPSERGELDRLPKESADDARKIRALLDEKGPPPAALQAEVPKEPQPVAPGAVAPKDAKGAVRARAGQAHADASAEAQQHPVGAAGPSATAPVLALQGDAKQMLTTRGLPLAISTRDGLLALRYEEPRPCAAGSCATLIDYLFNGSGGLVREETAGPAAPRGPRPKADEQKGDEQGIEPPAAADEDEPATPAKPAKPSAPADDEFKGDD